MEQDFPDRDRVLARLIELWGEEEHWRTARMNEWALRFRLDMAESQARGEDPKDWARRSVLRDWEPEGETN